MGDDFLVEVGAVQESLQSVGRAWDEHGDYLPDRLRHELTNGARREVARLQALNRMIVDWAEGALHAPKEPRLDKPYFVSESFPVGKATVFRIDADDEAFIPVPSAKKRPSNNAEIDLAIYLDEYKDEQLEQVQRAALEFAASLGYGDFDLHDEVKGSIFRRWTGKLKQGVTSETAHELLAQAEQRLHLEMVAKAQAEVDSINSASAVNLIASLADVPNAVVRVGAIMLGKYTDPGADGPIVWVRPLSVMEIRALERNPGIQRDPRHALELLARAVYQLENEPPEDQPPAIEP